MVYSFLEAEPACEPDTESSSQILELDAYIAGCEAPINLCALGTGK
jgi:hypothetical protein